jgi:hypothetical protein
MSRFASIQKGTRARQTVDCPAPIDAGESSEKLKVDLVVLSGDDDADAHEAARAYAVGKGSVTAAPGDVHYDLGLMVHQLVRSSVDPDVPGSFAFFFASPDDDPALRSSQSFERMALVVLARFDRESIAYLHQLQEVWQDECAPWGKHADEAQILDSLEKLEAVVDPSVPFQMFRPATVGSLLLTTVKQRAALLRDKLGPGLSSANGTPSAKPSSQTADA